MWAYYWRELFKFINSDNLFRSRYGDERDRYLNRYDTRYDYRPNSYSDRYNTRGNLESRYTGYDTRGNGYDNRNPIYNDNLRGRNYIY